MSRSRDPDDIRPLLDELQETLSALRAEVDGREATESLPRRRPPSPGDFLRFTDEYTIPTLIALLETTIRSLELLRGVIRLIDPERTLSAPDQSASRERVTRGASAALSELRRALTEVDLPPDSDARDIVADARSLSAELDRRIDEFERGGASERDDGNGPVRIDVHEEDGTERAGRRDSTDDGDHDADTASVDVESELDSIREEVRGSVDSGSDSGKNEGEEET